MEAGKGNDKGKVEGLVKYSRSNFMVPIPEAASYDDLNAMLATRCRARQGDHAGRLLARVLSRARPTPDIAKSRRATAIGSRCAALGPATDGRLDSVVGSLLKTAQGKPPISKS